jgi:SAM-dependent methyltransferase
MSKQSPEYLQGNINAWQKLATKFAEWGEEAWDSDHPYWGIFEIPEEEIRLLPEDMSGLRCIELGCGTAYVSAWMCRRGAEVVAIDPTPNQLATARRLQKKHQLDFVIEEGIAESVPYPDESFDFAISEYGAALWADPHQWIPEASRLLKTGGQLVFLTNSPLWVMCSQDYESDGPPGSELLRPYFDMHKTIWPDCPGETEFHLTHGDWIALLRANGFSIEHLVELRALPGSKGDNKSVGSEWATQWPHEEVWKVRKIQPR